MLYLRYTFGAGNINTSVTETYIALLAKEQTLTWGCKYLILQFMNFI